MYEINVRFITDYVCPYCYVAKKIFLKAAEEFDVNIQWLTCESTKITEPGVDVFHDMAKKRQYKKEIQPYLRKYDIPMNLPPAVVPRPYTRLAALGGLYAEEQARRKIYDQAVMDAYFLEEKDIGEEDVLLDIAVSVGLDREGFRNALHDEAAVRLLEEKTRQIEEEIHPKTLPTILIDDTVRLEGGIYTVEKYRKFLDRASRKINAVMGSIYEPEIHKDGREEDFSEWKIVKGQGCSIDGCY